MQIDYGNLKSYYASMKGCAIMKNLSIKKRMCARLVVAAVLGCLASAAHPVGAITLSYTDTVQSPGNSINYLLDFGVPSGNTYNATFTVSHTADTTPEWYAAWFTFNFSTGSNPATIANLTDPSGTGPWSVLTSSTDVLKGGGQYGSPLDAGAAGFYVASIASGAPADSPTQGIFVTGSLVTTTPKTFTFDFTTNGGTLHDGVGDNEMPFKVGYYNKDTGATKWTVNRLSAELDVTKVPEPGTLLLLGSGILGIGLMGRKFRGRS